MEATMTDWTVQVQQARESTEKAKARLLTTFSFVPDEKVHWAPSQSARTALQIVAHCGMGNRAFAAILRGEAVPLPADFNAAVAQIRTAGDHIATREEAVRLVEETSGEVLDALDNVTPELLETVPTSPFGAFPFSVWMEMPGMHMNGHTPQIDYLQTIWGDLDWH